MIFALSHTASVSLIRSRPLISRLSGTHINCNGPDLITLLVLIRRLSWLCFWFWQKQNKNLHEINISSEERKKAIKKKEASFLPIEIRGRRISSRPICRFCFTNLCLCRKLENHKIMGLWDAFLNWLRRSVPISDLLGFWFGLFLFGVCVQRQEKKSNISAEFNCDL